MLPGERDRRLDPGTVTVTMGFDEAALLLAYANAGLVAREALPMAPSDAREAVDRGKARRTLGAIADRVQRDVAAHRRWDWLPPEPKRQRSML